MKSRKLIVLYLIAAVVVFVLAAFNVSAAEDATCTVLSPSGEIRFDLYKSDTALEYSVTDASGYTWIEKSAIEFIIDRVRYFSSDSLTGFETSEKTDSYSHIGNFSHVDDRYTLAEFTFDKDGYTFFMYVAVFDDGVALRYIFPDSQSERKKIVDHTAFTLTDDAIECWYGVNNTSCEGEITAHDLSTKSKDEIFLPITAVLAEGKYLSIMEADVSSSMGGTILKCLKDHELRLEYVTTDTRTGELRTPWRVVNFADSLDELVNIDNIYTLCEPCDEETYADTDWIVPGRSVWSWGVTQGWPSPSQMIDYTECASKLGFEYNIIDDGWPHWEDYRKELKLIGEYGDKVNVRQILWCAITEGTAGINKLDTFAAIDDFLAMMKECHLDGAKTDFWWKEYDARTGAYQNYFITKCADEKMVVDLHGCCKNSGTNRTYPNELTREGVRGLEAIGASNRTRDNEKYSEYLTAQLFTRYLAGHADWTPTVDSAMEIASVICIDSPLMSIASDPEDILDSPAREFIKSIPTTWDETVVLSSSEIGKRAVYAKEKSGTWFVGGIYSDGSTDVNIVLAEFLPEGVTFFADIWDDCDGKTVHTTKTVTSSDNITLSDKTKGTGFAVRFSPIELSAYGGEITGAVKITCTDEAAEVFYTLDGTDPFTSPTAHTYEKPLTLKESCTLTVSVKCADGYDTTVRCNFNLLSGGEEEADTPFAFWKKVMLPARLGRGIMKF